MTKIRDEEQSAREVSRQRGRQTVRQADVEMDTWSTFEKGEKSVSLLNSVVLHCSYVIRRRQSEDGQGPDRKTYR